MGGQSKNTHQQDQYSRPVLNVVIQFTGNPTQTKKPDHLQWAEQTADPLKQEWNKERKTSETICIQEKKNDLYIHWNIASVIFSLWFKLNVNQNLNIFKYQDATDLIHGNA